MKIVINNDWGGYGLSHEAVMRYAEIKGIKLYPDKKQGFYLYYIVPKEQYEKAHAEDIKRGYFKESNKLCFHDNDIPRNDETLIKVIEELGIEKSSGELACLKIVEIPDGVDWEISDYDGMETIHEKHRSWG